MVVGFIFRKLNFSRLIILVFLRKANVAKNRTIPHSEFTIDGTVIPIGDRPKNSPEIAAKLKLKAADNTACSTQSSFPSWKRKLIRQ